MTLPVKFTYVGYYGDAEYYRYEIDYADLSEELTDGDLISAAVYGAPHWGGSVDHDLKIVTVYPSEDE